MTTYTAPWPLPPSNTRSFFVSNMLTDFPITSATATKAVTGFVLDTAGAAMVGATVKLFRIKDDFLCGVTTSGALGGYSIARDVADPNTYYAIAYSLIGGVTQVHGTTDRNLVPA